MKYRKKPVVIEATQWHKRGDHAAVSPHGSDESPCKHCNLPLDTHGWIKTLEGGHIVCPGDWIITGVHGENYPCKPVIFEKTYEPAQ